MAKRTVSEQLDSLERKVVRLQADLSKFESWESRFDSTMEKKIFEVRTIAYLLLLITAVQLALTFGALWRQLGG